MLVLSGSQEGGEEQINRRPNNFLKQYTQLYDCLIQFLSNTFLSMLSVTFGGMAILSTVLQVSEVKAFHVYYNSRCTHCNVKLKNIEPFNI